MEMAITAALWDCVHGLTEIVILSIVFSGDNKQPREFPTHTISTETNERDRICKIYIRFFYVFFIFIFILRTLASPN